MALYNRKKNRDYYNSSEFEKRTITDSEIIHLYHDREPEIEETIETTTMWNPVDRKIYGYLNCSNNPPFPEAYAGQMFVIQAGGMIGGYAVSQGDSIECISKYSAEGYGEDVRERWILNSSGTSYNFDKSNNIRKIVKDINQSLINIDNVHNNSIIRRFIICIKNKYPEDTKVNIRIGNDIISIDIGMYNIGDIIEENRNFYLKEESGLFVTIPEYQFGDAILIVEYYPLGNKNE